MSHTKKVTVMGPGALDTPGDMLDPPILTSKTDKLAYRRSVRMWYECVQSSAECGYAKAKGTAGNLGHALFTKMDPRYKKIIISAIDAGILRLRTHQDGTKYTDEDHVKCVERIMNLVAKESSTDRVKRLIRMVREVYECKRDATESFQEFSDRFEGLARAYLSLAKVRPDSPDEQNFAIIAIENAALPISTYNTIINNLVSHSKENTKKSISYAPTETLKELTSDIPMIHTSLIELANSSSDETESANKIKGVTDFCQQLNTKAREIVIPPDDAAISEPKDEYVISLSKALEELRHVKMESEVESKPVMPIGKSKDTAHDKPKEMGTMMGARNAHNRNGKHKYGGPRNRYGSGIRKNSQYYRKKASQYHYSDSDPTEYTTDEDEDAHEYKGRNVFDRLGSRKMNIDAPHKKVRFDLDKKKSVHSRFPSSDSDGDSDSNSYFRRGDRRSS